MKTSYLYLMLAIVSEVVATGALKATGEFSRLWPSLVVIMGYASAFFFMTLSLRTIPVGITYAIWSGVGTACISIIGAVVYKQHLDLPAMIGVALIIGGVAVINLFSASAGH